MSTHPHANEEDVVIAFRQAVEEEFERARRGETTYGDIFEGGASTEVALHRLVSRHEDLQREVALLRTIVLRLVSEPVDE
jgi:hypothetical protein